MNTLEPSIKALEMMWVEGNLRMLPIVAYLKDQVFPTKKDEACKLRRRLVHFVFIDDVLYKRSFSSHFFGAWVERKPPIF